MQSTASLADQFPIIGEGPCTDFIAQLAVLALCPDPISAKDTAEGFAFTGEQPQTYLWQFKPNPELLFALANHKKEREHARYRLPSKTQQPVLIKQLREEAATGWWQPEVSIAEVIELLGNICLYLYVGVQQQRKFGDDWIQRKSPLLETLYMSCLFGISAMLRQVHSEWGSIDLRFCKDD